MKRKLGGIALGAVSFLFACSSKPTASSDGPAQVILTGDRDEHANPIPKIVNHSGKPIHSLECELVFSMKGQRSFQSVTVSAGTPASFDKTFHDEELKAIASGKDVAINVVQIDYEDKATWYPAIDKAPRVPGAGAPVKVEPTALVQWDDSAALPVFRVTNTSNKPIKDLFFAISDEVKGKPTSDTIQLMSFELKPGQSRHTTLQRVSSTTPKFRLEATVVTFEDGESWTPKT